MWRRCDISPGQFSSSESSEFNYWSNVRLRLGDSAIQYKKNLDFRLDPKQGPFLTLLSCCPQAPVPGDLAVKHANLDALRALAVALVLVDHVLSTITFKHPEYVFHPYDWGLGRLGVLLFFVHTSLVLNYSMVRLRLRGWPLLRSFFVRRAFRLYPLSVMCVLLVVVLSIPEVPWADDYTWRGWGNFLSNIMLTTNLTLSQPVLGPLWSLPIEAQMYVALPVIYLFLASRRNAAVAIAALWLVSVAAAYVQPLISDRLNVVGFAPYFIAGVCAYVLTSDGRRRERLPALLWLPCLVGLVCIYLLVQSSAGGIYSRPLQWMFCIAVALMIPLFRDSTIGWLNRATHLVAKYSYGIYLFHCIALSIACGPENTLPELLQWMLALILLAGLSVASFHLIEKPAINYGARLAARMDVSQNYPVESGAAAAS